MQDYSRQVYLSKNWPSLRLIMTMNIIEMKIFSILVTENGIYDTFIRLWESQWANWASRNGDFSATEYRIKARCVINFFTHATLLLCVGRKFFRESDTATREKNCRCLSKLQHSIWFSAIQLSASILRKMYLHTIPESSYISDLRPWWDLQKK